MLADGEYAMMSMDGSFIDVTVKELLISGSGIVSKSRADYLQDSVKANLSQGGKMVLC